MPDRYRIIITRRAAADLTEIHSYIEKSSPQNASDMAAKIIKAIDSLDQLPHRYQLYKGRRRPTESVRRLLVSPFHVYYTVDDRRMAVTIIAIRHGARRQPRRFDK